MCGRYSLALRPSQVRQMLQNDDMPVWDAPEDEGDGAPRNSFNFAPGYNGIVYRADVPDWGAGPRRERGTSTKAGKATPKKGRKATESNEDEDEQISLTTANADPPASTQESAGDANEATEVHYKMQSMKWGLIPFWTKRNPDYASMLKTINCRDDSLAAGGGMWNTMKARKRCIVVAQGFYEWLKSGKEKVPHFVKRKDGHLMCFAGLWDCVQYEDTEQKQYTYTIITTDSNKQLKFLHDRMPVILDPASERMKTWLDPSRYEWNKELQDILRPYDGELEVYPVSKDVGKVGNNSASFIIPVASKDNKANIANFFANANAKATAKNGKTQQPSAKVEPEVEVKVEGDGDGKTETKSVRDALRSADDGGMTGTKRPGDDEIKKEEPSPKKGTAKHSSAAMTPSPLKSARGKISATSNGTKSPSKSKSAGTQKITKFFGNSA